MTDVWQIRSAQGTSEHRSADLAFGEMDRLVLAGAPGVTFEKKTVKNGRMPASPPPADTVPPSGPDGQTRIQI